MTFRSTLSQFWFNIQTTLFPFLNSHIGFLSPEYQTLVAVLELIKIEEFLPCTKFNFGRPCKDRARIARAFIAKVVLKITHTKQLVNILKRDKHLRMICGWEEGSTVPSESKFSRVFQEFAEISLPDNAHQLRIKEVYKDKTVGHLIKDSTSITAREKPLKKQGSSQERKKQANERYIREKNGELGRKQKQRMQTLDEMLHDLPISCDIGAKKNAQGYMMVWKGYKLHAAVDDNCIPIAAILTSASLNDCEAAIPLAEKSNKLVKNFYDLMDSAYDVKEVKEHSLSLGHVPIIDKHCRSKAQKLEKEAEKKRKRILNAFTAEDKRYKERFSKERFNALFKEYYGGKGVQYKGYKKVFCHSMFGILVLTATSLLMLSQ